MNPILTGNLILLALVFILLLLLRRVSPPRRAAGVLLAGFTLQVGGFDVATFTPTDRFGAIQLITWLLFFHNVIFLGGVAALAYRRGWPASRAASYAGAASALLVVGLLLLAVDAFLIEPHALEVSRVTIVSRKVAAPLRIAVISDIQSDAPGPYEAGALARVKAEQPDLILLAGDYVQADTADDYAQTIEQMRDLFRQAGLSAPLGAYAIQGNTDQPGRWQVIFDGLPVTALETTTRLDLGPLVLTALSLDDSFRSDLAVPGEAKFHIVMGHSPNYSLGSVNADLLVAGHTHGGQVRLPLLGPLITLSSIPRAWADEVHTIAPGKTLLVSRGIGLERHNAPRLRFNCRPEVVIITVKP